MNYYRYYISPDSVLAKTFRLTITAHLLPDDEETVFCQSLNIRASEPKEAFYISILVRNDRFNRLYTSTRVSDLVGTLQSTHSSGPNSVDIDSLPESGLQMFNVTVVREAGADPVTGKWWDQCEDHLIIQAPDEQQAHRLADFISALPFNGQIRKTIINDVEHLDGRY